MPSPFPGMDPYLESPVIWPDMHHGLVSEIRAALNQIMTPSYVACIEFRVYVSDEVGVVLSDDEIKEARIEIKGVLSKMPITIMELISPATKIEGSTARKSFMQKKREVSESDVNWVEIDLLRAGLPSVTNPPLVPSDYRVLGSRAGRRTKARYWPFGVRQTLPVVGIPLTGKDADVPLDLGAVFKGVYDRAAYERSINYRKPPRPPLESGDAAWAKDLLRKHLKK